MALGFKEAATLHRTVAVWVLGDKEEAERFAEFVTREIDPAYVTAALSPLNEIAQRDRRSPSARPAGRGAVLMAGS